MKICWISKGGSHFDSQAEANQYDLECELSEMLTKIFDEDSYYAYRIRIKRKEVLAALNEYYKKGGK